MIVILNVKYIFKKLKISNFINVFRVIKLLERMDIIGGQNTESVNIKHFFSFLEQGTSNERACWNYRHDQIQR